MMVRKMIVIENLKSMNRMKTFPFFLRAEVFENKY